MADEKPKSIPVQPPEEPPQRAGPPPPARPTSRLLGNAIGRRPMRLPPGVTVNTGDLIGAVGPMHCPADDWPRAGDVTQQRRAFAASFAGVSVSSFRMTRGTRPGPQMPLAYEVGGEWFFPVQGDVMRGNGLGPAIDPDTGRMRADTLEKVPDDQAVAWALEALEGGWKVELNQ